MFFLFAYLMSAQHWSAFQPDDFSAAVKPL